MSEYDNFMSDYEKFMELAKKIDFSFNLKKSNEIIKNESIAKNAADKRLLELEKLSNTKTTLSYRAGSRQGFIECFYKIQSLEKEVARLKDEILKLRNCENCIHYDAVTECELTAITCTNYNKWEIKK